jgi:radical SAM protein with 4Fe4S-binding SPASM domain
VVCLIDPVGDVYACPFAIHDQFLAGNVRSEGGFRTVWQDSELFAELRGPQSGGACTKCSHYDACQGGCMAAKFFTGLPLDGPDPECVLGNGERELAKLEMDTIIPKPSLDHSHRTSPRTTSEPVPLTHSVRRPDKACDSDPLAGEGRRLPAGMRVS